MTKSKIISVSKSPIAHSCSSIKKEYMTDFSTYKFRCSALKNLMVTPRSKTEVLSETTKSYLREVYIQEVYGREKPDIDTKYTQKGIIVESDSLELVRTVTGETFFKNNEHFTNDYIQGTPDVVAEKKIIDIKSSFDIWTFASVDSKKAKDLYYYQVLGYMWLTGKESASLDFCLVNTPEEIISKELYRMSFTVPGLTEGGGEVEKALRKNYEYEDIDAKERLKQFAFDFSKEDIDTLKLRIDASRVFLADMKL